MTVAEYTAASNARRQLHSQLARAELEATKAAIARLRTAAGRVEIKRRANSHAGQLLKNAKLAQRIAQLAMLQKESMEEAELGPQRLLAATAEMYGVTVETVASWAPGRRGRPPTTEHGLRMYKTGRCKCDEVCRPANAEAQQRYKERRKLREQA